jgi:(S)-2-hydroxyglutarate dehydrogenase
MTYDLVIVGGGIVGLATARETIMRFPHLRILVLEKETEIASHQAAHNSGVIHAGIYYTPGSLKAKACVEGHRLIMQYAEERGVPYERCGKVIVALDESELPRLNTLFERGNKNGVQGLEMITPERLKEIEPYATGIAAIYSPNTGIIDYAKVAHAYADDFTRCGGEIRTGSKVVGITAGKESVIRVQQTNGSQQEVRAKHIITCSGLYADKLANMTGQNADPNVQIVPFRGDYYLFKPEKAFMTRGLIYPVPDPRFPFLGVHFTKVMNGEVWAGPNAVLAFAREGYKRTDVNFRELVEAVRYPGFQKLALKYWKKGAMEMYRDFFKAAYVKELQRYMPALKGDDLVPGPSGVRAQALARDGSLVEDFLIRRGEHVVHVQNAPSPAATSSLVVARMIVDEAQQSFGLSERAALTN